MRCAELGFSLAATAMPLSKKRKLKPIVAAVPAAEKTSQPNERAGLWRIIKIIGAIGSVLACGTAAAAYWPRVSVEPTDPSQASNPFSGVFQIGDPLFYSLHDVRIQAFLWCATIGRGTDDTPPSMCERGMASSPRAWNHRVIERDRPYQVDIGNVLFATPSALLYADISIKVTFQPWYIPRDFEREFRFYTRRRDDGTIQWLHRPLD
jgi:hypothetical protein